MLELQWDVETVNHSSNTVSQGSTKLPQKGYPSGDKGRCFLHGLKWAHTRAILGRQRQASLLWEEETARNISSYATLVHDPCFLVSNLAE